MKYVINPWIIYAIDKLDVILIIAITAIILCLIAIFILWLLENDNVFEGKGFYSKHISKAFIVLIISIIVVCICPTTKTATKMLVASYVTDTNLENAKEEVVEIIDYISTKVNEGE